MNISELQFLNQSFEIRYAPAYLLYDVSGKIWSSVRDKWSDIKPVEAAPNSSRFVVGNEAELGVLLEKAHVIWPGKRVDQKKFYEYSSFIFDAVKSDLGVGRFTRIGLRQIFAKKFKSAEDASNAVLGSGLLKAPSIPMFGIEGILRNAEMGFRYESDSLGWHAKLASRSRKFNVDPPLGEEDDIPKVDAEYFEVVLDIDCYTLASTSVGKFKAEEWITQTQRLVRRDSIALLGG
jgi:hypothetical protein